MMDVPKFDIDSILDKIKRAQAGENVPGVVLFDGQKAEQALNPPKETQAQGSYSGLKILAVAAIVGIVAMPKKKSK